MNRAFDPDMRLYCVVFDNGTPATIDAGDSPCLICFASHADASRFRATAGGAMAEERAAGNALRVGATSLSGIIASGFQQFCLDGYSYVVAEMASVNVAVPAVGAKSGMVLQ